MKQVLILIVCAIFFSCNKNEDIGDVIITINSPKNGSVFPANQRVPIKIDLSAKDGLNIFHFRVVESATNMVILDWQQNTRSVKSFQIDTACTVQSNSINKLTIEAFSDKGAVLKVENVFSGQ